MNSLCPLYFKSTFNQQLFAVLCFKPYTKLCDLYSFLKLKTIHKCFLCPYQRQSSMLCFIAFKYSRTPCAVKSRCNIPIYMYYEYSVICLCWHNLFVFKIKCNKSSTTRLRLFYITFYLCCKCATFSSQCNEA